MGVRADDVFTKKRTSAQTLLDRVEAIFGTCSGVGDCITELRSEAELSLHDMRTLKRWDFDDLSWAEAGFRTCRQPMIVATLLPSGWPIIRLSASRI